MSRETFETSRSAQRPLRRADVVAMISQVTDASALDLRYRDMAGIDLSRMDLRQADLCGADLNRADLSDANLSGADLTAATLTGSTLTGANATAATLTMADMSQANLTGATLTGASLNGAILTKANLTRAMLTVADLSGATLAGANLTEATLTDAILTEASLSGANLTGANLNGANLSGTDLTGAIIGPPGSRWEDHGVRSATSVVPNQEGSRICVLLTEDPLTATSLSMLATALADLHATCWLMLSRRLGDLARFACTHDQQLLREANLAMTVVSQPRGVEVSVDPGEGPLRAAITHALEAIAHPEAQQERASLARRGSNEELQLKVLRADLAAKHGRDAAVPPGGPGATVSANRVAVEHAQAELERTCLEIARKQDELRLQAVRAGTEMVYLLHPTASADMRAMLVEVLMPTLVQLGSLSIAVEHPVGSAAETSPRPEADFATPAP